MIPLRPAEGVSELLDEVVHDARELESSLAHVDAVNRWLGGNRGVLRALDRLVPRAARVRILDVGTGSAALPCAIAGWARRRSREVTIVGADLHPQIAALARRKTARYPEVAIERADAQRLPHRSGTFQVAVLSLALHHFEGPNRVAVLREAGRVAGAVIVSELERCWPNYLGARVLAATWWRGNRLTRHDGPLSVRRAFTAAELLELAHRAGLGPARVRRHFFHRLLLVAGAERPWTLSS